MSTLRGTIDRLASQFASSIIEALRGASLEELLAVAGASGASGRRASASVETTGRRASASANGRLGRRSPDQIGAMVEGIVDLLAKSEAGLRAEEIRAALGVQAKELPRPLADALAAGRITKSGQKRATTYFATGGAGAPRKAKRAGARGRKKS